MGGKLETFLTAGMHYQEVKYCCQSANNAAADKAAADLASADKAAEEKVASDMKAAHKAAAIKAAADRAAAIKAAAEKAKADKAATDKTATEKAAKEGACSISVGDQVKLKSDTKKLDAAYKQQGMMRMLSAGSAGKITKVKEKMVLLKREGKTYWVPIDALAGFEECEEVKVVKG